MSAAFIGAIAGGVGGGMVVLIAIILLLILAVLFLKRKGKGVSIHNLQDLLVRGLRM